MNCNPFTNGHRYLIETAASLVDQLYVFILEEEGEKPLFNFRIRKELVIKGVEDLKNVVVLNSGSFIISKITFPEYFQKDDLISQRIDCTKDVLSFCENIVPALNLKKRFVGTEPTCNVTSQYNLALKEILPKYGVELIEIERKVHNDSAISASTVRRLIKKKKYGEIKDIVPRTTYEYIVRTFE
jgi:[citrate (pro-3S)-lyase] ligase